MIGMSNAWLMRAGARGKSVMRQSHRIGDKCSVELASKGIVSGPAVRVIVARSGERQCRPPSQLGSGQCDAWWRVYNIHRNLGPAYICSNENQSNYAESIYSVKYGTSLDCAV